MFLIKDVSICMVTKKIVVVVFIVFYIWRDILIFGVWFFNCNGLHSVDNWERNWLQSIAIECLLCCWIKNVLCAFVVNFLSLHKLNNYFVLHRRRGKFCGFVLSVTEILFVFIFYHFMVLNKFRECFCAYQYRSWTIEFYSFLFV